MFTIGFQMGLGIITAFALSGFVIALIATILGVLQNGR